MIVILRIKHFLAIFVLFLFSLVMVTALMMPLATPSVSGEEDPKLAPLQTEDEGEEDDSSFFLGTAFCAGIVIAIVIQFILGVWTYQDADQREQDEDFWAMSIILAGIFTVVGGFALFAVYYYIRSEKKERVYPVMPAYRPPMVPYYPPPQAPYPPPTAPRAPPPPRYARSAPPPPPRYRRSASQDYQDEYAGEEYEEDNEGEDSGEYQDYEEQY